LAFVPSKRALSGSVTLCYLASGFHLYLPEWCDTACDILKNS
jgi:hypothetical protein